MSDENDLLRLWHKNIELWNIYIKKEKEQTKVQTKVQTEKNIKYKDAVPDSIISRYEYEREEHRQECEADFKEQQSEELWYANSLGDEDE